MRNANVDSLICSSVTSYGVVLYPPAFSFSLRDTTCFRSSRKKSLPLPITVAAGKRSALIWHPLGEDELLFVVLGFAFVVADGL